MHMLPFLFSNCVGCFLNKSVFLKIVYFPSFREHHQRMSSMMRGFGGDPFFRSLNPHFGFPAPALPGVGNGGQVDRSNRRDQMLAPTDMFGGMFTNMNSMMANMHRNFVSVYTSHFDGVGLYPTAATTPNSYIHVR